MDISDWLPWKCWICEGNDFDESQMEVKVSQSKGTDLPPRAGGDAAMPAPNWNMPSAVAPAAKFPRGAEGSQSSGASAGSPRNQERARLRELMKSFVNRGMKGVSCQVVDEATGALRPRTYIIDERLQRVSFQPDSSDASVNEQSFASHNVHFAQVNEVLRPEDGEDRFPPEALAAMSEDQRKRLVMLVYSVGEPDPECKVIFLEASFADRQRFLTCVRILRQYMDDQGATMI